MDNAWPWANDTYGLCSYVVIPQIGIAMGFWLQIRMSWLGARLRRAASGAGAAAGVVSWESAPVLASADCARCGGKLAGQAAYILVPASRMSTGRGILPSYLGLRWCNFLFHAFFLRKQALVEHAPAFL